MKFRCVYIIDGKKHYGEWLDAEYINIGFLARNKQFMDMLDNWYLEFKDGE